MMRAFSRWTISERRTTSFKSVLAAAGIALLAVSPAAAQKAGGGVDAGAGQSGEAGAAPPPAVGALATGETFQDCAQCPEMIVLPGGSFVMGTPANEVNRDIDEGPEHVVTVQSFALGRTEVTVGQYRRFVKQTGRQTPSDCLTFEEGAWYERAPRSWAEPGFEQGENEPVLCVTFADAQAYAAWMSNVTGEEYRLPTEAEWEYAARAGSTAAYPWNGSLAEACRYVNAGDQNWAPDNLEWPVLSCNDGYRYTAPVASYAPNAAGLHDMIGNVYEWTADCWLATYEGAPTDGSAATEAHGADCWLGAIRGGAWVNAPSVLRSGERWTFNRTARIAHVGFRVARSVSTMAATRHREK